MSSLAMDWQGEYASYDRPEDWLPRLEEDAEEIRENIRRARKRL